MSVPNNFGKWKAKRASAPTIPSYNIIKEAQGRKRDENSRDGSLDNSKSDSGEESSSEVAKNKYENKNDNNIERRNGNKNKSDSRSQSKSQSESESDHEDERNDNIKELNKDYRKFTGAFRNYNGFVLSSTKLSRMLKDILTEKLCLKDFSDWFNSVILSMQDDNLHEFVALLECMQDCEDLSTEFFKYIYNLARAKNKGYKYICEAEKLYKQNRMGPIVFITPELGRWTSVGKLGRTVDQLTQGLRTLGQEIIVISPYYYQNNKGKTRYLENDPFNFTYMKDISIMLDDNYSFGIYHGKGDDGVKYYFIENKKIFPRPYPNFNTADTLREISCLANASLELLININITPSTIVTNDWVTGLTAAFGKDGSFGDAFKHTKFVHLCHNLEQPFEGRLPYSNNNLQNIYKFNPDYLIDPYGNPKCFNPSRCAILKSDQWGTLSKAYKRTLQLNSSLADILNQKPCPFGYPNGIFINKKLRDLNKKNGGNKRECKRYIQRTYFKYNDADYSAPIFSFVGDIVEDKGVHLILDSFEELLNKTRGDNFNIIICNTSLGNQNSNYFRQCANKMYRLKQKYPYRFWANPDEVFKDTATIYLGSDFGLMPSSFEPGGVRQHYYFISETPVLGFKTGTLKDTITEFNYKTNNGNGVSFDYYNMNDFVEAFVRANNLFKDNEKYSICCKNARNSAVDMTEVAKALCKDFCKLQHKMFFNGKEVLDTYMSKVTDDMLIREFREARPSVSTVNVPRRITKRNSNIYGMDAFHSGKGLSEKLNFGFENSGKNFMQDDEVVKKFVYTYNNSYQPKVVEISGSFDGWKKRHRLIHYPREQKWEISIKMKKRKYYYKYIIDGNWQVNKGEPTEVGQDGITNNVFIL